MFTTITDLYNAYTEKFGSEQPVWSRDELLSWKQDLGKRYEELTNEDLDAAYEESMQEAMEAAGAE